MWWVEPCKKIVSNDYEHSNSILNDISFIISDCETEAETSYLFLFLHHK